MTDTAILKWLTARGEYSPHPLHNLDGNCVPSNFFFHTSPPDDHETKSTPHLKTTSSTFWPKLIRENSIKSVKSLPSVSRVRSLAFHIPHTEKTIEKNTSDISTNFSSLRSKKIEVSPIENENASTPPDPNPKSCNPSNLTSILKLQTSTESSPSNLKQLDHIHPNAISRVTFRSPSQMSPSPSKVFSETSSPPLLASPLSLALRKDSIQSPPVGLSIKSSPESDMNVNLAHSPNLRLPFFLAIPKRDEDKLKISSPRSEISPPLTPHIFKYSESLLCLHQNYHTLTRALIIELTRIAADATSNALICDANHAEHLCTTVLKLHGEPEQLFLFCLANELSDLKNLATVMRERSASVRVLQYIWKSLDTTELVRPMLKYLKKLSISNLQRMTEDSAMCPPTKRDHLKQKLYLCVESLLRPTVIPTRISVLCHWCIKLVESNDEVEKAENDSVSRWAVGALIFLRFLIPAVTDVASGTSGAYEREKKGAVLMGRFLMKLCCKSKFGEHSSCLLNDVLDDAADMFDRFCHDVAMIGQEYSHITFPDLVALDIPEKVRRNKYDLYDFLEEYSSDVKLKCCELFDNSIKTKSELSENLFQQLMSNFNSNRSCCRTKD
jgi:hypothetical protein